MLYVQFSSAVHAFDYTAAEKHKVEFGSVESTKIYKVTAGFKPYPWTGPQI